MNNMNVFEYNSAREALVMPEYGRHIQKMVRNLKTMQDAEERQAYANAIIKLMIQMNPQNKTIEDYEIKMWKHLFHIAEYDIVLETPNGETPEPPSEKQVEHMLYPKTTKYKHYGMLLHTMVDRAIDMEVGYKKNGFIQLIGSFMKMAHRNWNKDTHVDDDLIRKEIVKVSKGHLEATPEMTFDFYNGVRIKSNRSKNHRNNGRHKGRNKNRRR